MPFRSFFRFLQELTRQDEEDGEILNAMQSPSQEPPSAAPVRSRANGTTAENAGQPPRADFGK